MIKTTRKKFVHVEKGTKEMNKWKKVQTDQQGENSKERDREKYITNKIITSPLQFSQDRFLFFFDGFLFFSHSFKMRKRERDHPRVLLI